MRLIGQSVGVCDLVLAVGIVKNDLVFLNKGCNSPNFSHVIHMARSSIHMWPYFLPTNQREPLNIECNQMIIMVIRAILSLVVSIQDSYQICVYTFSVL
jgi:hypothetical protein